ncbi:hypothetical protein AYR63_00135 [Secundilactobacillus paracollinoides]|uniref:Uncharacterized protein n=2 Tax=Secundilactobacillus paracollinoides TaxID=240427 RepID=A0A1B2IUH4_9LACO|nr:hypothetical protein AYR63_00135 [Secundilactobacillus paracollinoides]
MLAALTCMGVLSILASPLYTKAANASEPSWTDANTTELLQAKPARLGASNDGTNLYVYLETEKSTTEIFKTFSASYGSGFSKVNKVFKLSAYKDGTVNVLDNSTGTVVGTATISQSATVLDATVNLKDAGLSNGVGKSLSVLGDVSLTGPSLAGTPVATTLKEASSESDSSSSQTDAQEAMSSSDSATSQSSSQANNNNISGNLGITIDGQYADWADKNPTDINIDNDNSVEVSLLSDDKNVYFYVESTPKLSQSSNNFQGNGYELKVGAQTYYITFGSANLSKAGDSQAVSVDIWNPSSGGSDNTTSGTAYVGLKNLQETSGSGTTTNTTWQLECAIPFSALGGTSDSSASSITLTNSNGWQGTVKDTGGSTGPAVIVASGFVIAGAALVKNARGKNKKRRGNK